MIKLFKLKEQQAAEQGKDSDATSAAHLRAQKGSHMD